MALEFQIGDEIGVYRVVRRIGAGGMGAVYEVEHRQLGVHYALKTYTFGGERDELLKNKFLAEGKVLARLHHPGLVRVFDLDFDDRTGTPYFVMDLVTYEDGGSYTLADVDTEDLEESYVLQWFEELASALDYIHAQGIVHRDIKLNNVLLNADKHIVLSDFGVSRFFSQNLRREVNAVNSMVSEVKNGGHLVMGTQGYMAPEVERGEEATPAADVYSLGVMLMYLLTGIWYDSGSKVLKFLETLEYPWKDVLPQMLAEDPFDRPPHLLDCVRRLKAAVSAASAPTVIRVPQPTPRVVGRTDPARRIPRPVLLAASLVAAVFVVAVGAFLWRDWLHSPTPAPAQTPRPVDSEFRSFFSASGIYEVEK